MLKIVVELFFVFWGVIFVHSIRAALEGVFILLKIQVILGK